VFTAIVILAANAYYANLESSPVGLAAQPITTPIAAAATAGAAGGGAQPSGD
jgi:hypothetical protein